MFATNTNLELRADAPPILHCDSNETSDAIAVEHLKWIVGKDTTFEIRGKESSRVIAAQAESCLRKIICSEGKELRRPGNPVGGKGSPG